MTPELPRTRREGRARHAEQAKRALEEGRTPTRGVLECRDGTRLPVLKPNGEDMLPAWLAPDEWFQTDHAERRRDTEPGRHGVLRVLAASALAGAVPGARDVARLRAALHDPVNAPEAFSLHEILVGINAEEWERLILDEVLTWREAAHIVRSLGLTDGALVYILNDHACPPKHPARAAPGETPSNTEPRPATTAYTARLRDNDGPCRSDVR